MENTEKNFYGIQFHPEVRHSVYGNDILKNFAFGICGAKGDWSMANFVDMQIAQIRETVGDRKVLLDSQVELIHLLLVSFCKKLLEIN